MSNINKEKDIEIKENFSLNLWEKYNNFVKYLHLKKNFKEPNLKGEILIYLKKTLLVFIGSFFTSAAFYFLIDPNNIYNNGLNGVLQSIIKLIICKKNLNWNIYYPTYFLSSFFINLILFIIFGLILNNKKWKLISTALVNSVSQIIWTKVFINFGLNRLIFNRFNYTDLKTSGAAHLSLTLPYFIFIACGAVAIHAIGTIIISRVQAIPGGFDIITASVSPEINDTTKDIKISKLVNKTIKIIQIISLFWIILLEINNGNSKETKVKLLEREYLKLPKSMISEYKNFNERIERWKKAMKKKNDILNSEIDIENYKTDRRLTGLFKSEEFKDITFNGSETDMTDEELEEEEKEEECFTRFLIERTGIDEIDKKPEEIDFFLIPNHEKYDFMENKIKELTIQKQHCIKQHESQLKKWTDRSNSKKERTEQKNKLKKITLKRIDTLSREIRALEFYKKQYSKHNNLVYRILEAISNNERLWATLVYIFLTTYIVKGIFAQNDIMSVNIICYNEKNKKKCLNLLEQYKPMFHEVFIYEKDKKVMVYKINVYMKRLQFNLQKDYLKQVGNIYEN